MVTPQFKVKIIGGKLVQVPDFDYIQGRNISGTKSSDPTIYSDNARKEINGISRPNKARENLAVDSMRDATQGYRSQSVQNLIATSEQSQMPKRMEMSLYNQRQINRMEAEGNRLKALNQLYQSVLEPDPIQRDIHEDKAEDETHDSSLANQIADCLGNANKQKLAFALRAMRRLDPKDSGYISVRDFRDVLLMYQIFIIGGTLEKLIEKYKSNAGRINYVKLWSFVTKSFDRNQPQEKVTGDKEESLFHHSIRNIERELKSYAHRHHTTYDFTDLMKSFENCDRSRTNILGVKEMRIICNHYLPIDPESLEIVMNHCDQQRNGWINYRSFVQILIDAQPTYLPPINYKRRDTYVLEKTIDDNGFVSNAVKKTTEDNRFYNNAFEKTMADNRFDNNAIEKTIEGNRFDNNARKTRGDRFDENIVQKTIEGDRSRNNADNGFRYNENNENNDADGYNDCDENDDINNGFHRTRPIAGPGREDTQRYRNDEFPSSVKATESSNTRHTSKGNEKDSNEISPRRKWYESEESWRKRNGKAKTRRRSSRKMWNQSEPVKSLRESTDKRRIGESFETASSGDETS